MSFLAPWLLALGLAVAVPILLHLMHRRPGPRLDFPALRYLRRAEKESGRRVRVRQMLLLALRIAAIVLLALAAARPFLRTGSSGHPPTDVVIVLDNSMSTGAVTGDGRVFDALRAAAAASLDASGPDDRFWLIRAAEPAQPALFGDRARVRAALDAVEPVDARADLRAATRRARALLEAARGGRPAEVHVITDLQATAFENDSASADDGGGAPVIVFGPAGEAPANRGVGDVLIAGGLAPRAGVGASASARVAGTGTDSVTLRLWLGDRPVSAALAAPGAAAIFALPPRPTGAVVGRIEAEPDALRADDRRWFAYTVTPPVAVATALDASFAAEALGALAAASRISLGSSAGAQVLVANAASLPLAAPTVGAIVLLAPDSAELLPAANAALARLGTGLRLEPDAARGAARIVSGDVGSGAELADARVARAYRIEVAPGTRVDTLLHLSDGRAWLVRARSRADQPVLLLATPLVPDASTVPASAAMIPLLDRMTGEWAGVNEGNAAALEAGTVVQLPARTGALQHPNDSIAPVEGGAPLALPARAGVYRALASEQPGSEVLAAWTVAAPASESLLQRAAPDRIDEALGETEIVTGDLGEWRDAIFDQRSGAEWWRALLILALIALLAESVISGVTRRPKPTGEIGQTVDA